ncbi:MAG TPA: phosphomannomutase/phosphoglucomutase [Gaiellaceae bacterium]|nr:phosphomannomutase/phosphoglucomutase [Gaiellaceae bacterium]
MLDPKVFKAYDVRGIHPTELDEDGAYAIGRAYVEQFEARRIAVGRDMRVSAPTMAAAVIEGAADGGADIVDLGLVGTEMVYFAVGDLGLDGGIAVTASHNPKEYTGMKIVRAGALPVGGESGLLDVRDRAQELVSQRPDVGRRGEVSTLDVYPAFVDKVLSFVDRAAIRPLRVVVDAANGMAGAMLPPVLERLPVSAVCCHFEPDGTFPNHEPNPLLPENREFIIRMTRDEGADLGVAYDGDADRCFFVDDLGEFVPGDFVTALLAESVLEKEPGGKVIYDVRASWAVPEAIERAGGEALVNRVGHAYIKHRMREEGAVFGGEVSAHYYFRDFSQADSGVVPFLLMLELISKRGRKLSELLAPFRERFFITGELNTPVADVPAKLRELEERYAAEARISHLDGVSVDADDWHFNVRPSNTEPLLRLNLEARSVALMEAKRDEVLELIRS